jgi:ElaA protein
MVELVYKDFSDLDLATLYDILMLREEVFNLEQHVSCADLDGIDKNCIFGLLYEQDLLIGTLRIIPGLEYYQIGRFCVKSKYRKNGNGKLLFTSTIDYIQSFLGVRKIVIEAQAYLLKFYQSVGFKVTSDQFLDGGIPHYQMELNE